MHRVRATTRSISLSPLGVFGIVLSSVFLVEASIMLVGVWGTEHFSLRSIGPAFADAMILTVVIAPVIWLLVVLPLRSLHQQRGVLLSRLFESQEQERARLARDLHDDLGQHLTAILLTLRASDPPVSLEQAGERLQAVRALASSSLEAVRRISRGLSPVVLADFGLREAAERLCEDLSALAKTEIVRSIDLPPGRLPAAVEIGAYRVLQEALANALKHSGATRIEVALRKSGDCLDLEVRDNGCGLAKDGAALHPGRPGLGLRSMQERVALLGGRFEIRSERHTGTALAARIPSGLEKA
ncbi:MAG: sensor histidine kinase [Phycisphaerae bacterium]|nr:sensor histidine kinase [Phycisphaerae bacterium]